MGAGEFKVLLLWHLVQVPRIDILLGWGKGELCLWHVGTPVPAIEPTLDLWPASQLQQYQILNPLCHKGTS